KKHISGFKGIKTTIVTLISQSIRRAYRLGIAMESKGFSDNKRTYYYKTSFSKYDLYFILLVLASIWIAILLGSSIPVINITEIGRASCRERGKISVVAGAVG